MKKHQTAKYKKRHKKELANRKAKRLATQQTQPVPVEPAFEPEEIAFTPEEAKPISPARRAFQDL